MNSPKVIQPHILVVDDDPQIRDLLHEYFSSNELRVNVASCGQEMTGILVDHSIDLVAVAQALHWFDLARFYIEVERVAKPGCVVACWSYGLLQINRDVDGLLRRLNERVLKDYWPLERRLVDERYSTADFPFAELKPPTFHMTQRWNLEQVLGYLGTWSSVRKFEEDEGASPLALIGDKLLAAWGDPAMVRQIVWPLYLRVGRVS